MSESPPTSESNTINVEETISETRNEILTLYSKLGDPGQQTYTRFIKEESPKSPIETRPMITCPAKDCTKALFSMKGMKYHIKKNHPELASIKQCPKCRRPY